MTIKLSKPIVLVGMPGSGKTTVGRRLAHRLDIPFYDADAEIEAAAGCTIAAIFARDGEVAFRATEKAIIARLLEAERGVLSTGGGAYMNAETRATIAAKGVSVWLKADLDILVARTARKTNRPLLQGGDPRQKLQDLLTTRSPVFALANITIDSQDRPLDETVDLILAALRAYTDLHDA